MSKTGIVSHGSSFQYALDVFNDTCNVDALFVTTNAFAPRMMKTLAKCYFSVIKKDLVPRIAISMFSEGSLFSSCNVHRMDQWGDHAVHCFSEVDVKFRLNPVHDILVELCSKVWIMVRKEAPMDFHSEDGKDLRLADLLQFNWIQVFVTNFPDNFGSRDLWKLCEAYGNVVDMFIPKHKSKAGRRFAFVRFIRVVDLVRLIGNLCTLWVGRFHLHANAVRYERPYLQAPIGHVASSFSSPTLVLDDSCIIERGLSRHAMGRVKDLNSIPNLQSILTKEGFSEVKFSYLGGMWVLLELDTVAIKKKLLQHTRVNSWFLALQDATHDFVSEERVFWVDIEGIPLNDFKHSEYTSNDESPLGTKSKLVDQQVSDDELVGESDDEGVLETLFGDKPYSPYNVVEEDPSLSHPSGFTPEVSQQANNHNSIPQKENSTDPVCVKEFTTNVHSKVMNFSQETHVKESSGGIYSSKQPHNVCKGGSILEVLDDMIRVGHSMGYDMEGCSKDIEHIIGMQGADSPVLKRILWGYISGFILRWNSEVIVMGDFNAVRSEDERFGSLFNPSCARDFNQFISSSSLMEIKTEGYSFTWSRPSATKMSKLDRFLVSEEQAWNSFSHSDPNRLIRFKKKLQDLKKIIRSWIKDKNIAQAGVKKAIIDDLVAIDKNLDNGVVYDEMLLNRMELTRNLNDLKQSEVKDFVQKAKVKWAIEGDENSKFFHGLINKKRQILDGPFVLNELLAWCKRKKKQALIFKVDFAKAYDSVGTISLTSCKLLDLVQIGVNGFAGNGPMRILGTLLESSNVSTELPGCDVMHTPFTYLCVTVGDHMTLSFFNGDDPSKRKITWIAWEKVLASKKNGGLGVSSLHALNRTLLLKWVWRFLSQDGSIWSRVINAIYGSSLASHSVKFSSPWCSILRDVQVLSAKGFDFVSHCKKRVGNGHNTRFWLDTWILDMPLSVQSPRMFALERDKQISVAAKWGASSFDASFRRQIRDGIERVFRVKEIRSILDDLLLTSLSQATRWVKFIPIKINIFAWRVRLDRLPTICNLLNRCVIMESSLCPLCGLVPEDSLHVFFWCDLAKTNFHRICRWWDLHWVDVSSFAEWNAWFSCIQMSSKLKLMMEGVFYIAWWHIWNFRNHFIFGVTPPRRSVIFDDIVSRSFIWCDCHPQQNSKNLGRSGLRYWKVSSWCNSVNHDEGKHEGDLCIDHMPHETIHQTIVEIWRFHYGDLLFLRGEKFIDEFGNKILPSYFECLRLQRFGFKVDGLGGDTTGRLKEERGPLAARCILKDAIIYPCYPSKDIPPKTRAKETTEVACRKVIVDREKKKRKTEATAAAKPKGDDDIDSTALRNQTDEQGPPLDFVKGNEVSTAGGEKGNGNDDSNVIIEGHGDTVDGLSGLRTQPSPLDRSVSHVQSVKKPIRDKDPLDAEASYSAGKCRDMMSNLFTPADYEFFNDGVPDGSAIKQSWKLLCQSLEQQANTLLRFEALTEEHIDLVHAHESCKDVKARYKECKKELEKIQSTYDENDRLEELEEEKKETKQLSIKQTERIKQLEEALKQSEDDAHQLRLDRERYVVECGNREMVRRRIINEYILTFVRHLHQSVEYKRSLCEVFIIAVGKGFIDGFSVARKDEDVRAILRATPGVDPTSSDTFMEEYNKLFDKRFPYVDKVVRAYLFDPTGLQNVMPDETSPTPGQWPRDTPTASHAYI
nr:RNA-directed DNA polymerase, eukaryota [Tanacetum cinerariifolium]